MTSLSPLQQLRAKYHIYGFYWTIRLTLQFLFRKFFFELLQGSHSQYGEDLQISQLLNKKKIFYIDIGANHPKKFNNTYLFYNQGSHGINVEPNPLLYKLYPYQRPNDINLNIGISPTSGILKFYQMFPDVNSTFSPKQCKLNLRQNSLLIDTPHIQVMSLSLMLDRYLPKKQVIDLLSIDTEGHDLLVLKSNNWQKYHPKLICVETQHNDSLHNYLLKLGYNLVGSTPINSLYVQKNNSVFSIPTSLRT